MKNWIVVRKQAHYNSDGFIGNYGFESSDLMTKSEAVKQMKCDESVVYMRKEKGLFFKGLVLIREDIL